MNEDKNVNIHKHPEWRRLLDALSGSLEIGRLYSYKELNAAAGIDIQSARGRGQFRLFAAEVLERYSLHFENERDKGYRIVPPRNQQSCGVRKVRRGHKQIQQAGRIMSHLQTDTFTPAEKAAAIDLAMRVARLEIVVETQAKKLDRLARGVELGRLPHPLLNEEEGDSKVQ